MYHLKRAGSTNKELSKVYRTVILPVADYCRVVYHPMLTDEQDQLIERLQSRALKCIFGLGFTYTQMRENAEVTTLRPRRIEASDKFAAKCLVSTQFSKWLPLRASGRAGSRGGKKYLEEFARRDRLMNIPLF